MIPARWSTCRSLNVRHECFVRFAHSRLGSFDFFFQRCHRHGIMCSHTCHGLHL